MFGWSKSSTDSHPVEPPPLPVLEWIPDSEFWALQGWLNDRPIEDQYVSTKIILDNLMRMDWVALWYKDGQLVKGLVVLEYRGTHTRIVWMQTTQEREGQGRHLLELVEYGIKHLWNWDAKELTMYVPDWKLAAHKFLFSVGYKAIAVRSGVYKGCDAYLFVKELVR